MPFFFHEDYRHHKQVSEKLQTSLLWVFESFYTRTQFWGMCKREATPQNQLSTETHTRADVVRGTQAWNHDISLGLSFHITFQPFIPGLWYQRPWPAINSQTMIWTSYSDMIFNTKEYHFVKFCVMFTEALFSDYWCHLRRKNTVQ